MSENQVQTSSQIENPIEKYKAIILERVKKAENMKGIAKTIAEDLMKFLKSLQFSVWGLSIVAYNERVVVIEFKAEQGDPTINVDILHVVETISGKIADDMKASIYTIKESSRVEKIVIEIKRE